MQNRGWRPRICDLFKKTNKVLSLLEHSCAIIISFKIVVIFNITSADFVLMSANVVLKMTTFFKEMRIAQLLSISSHFGNFVFGCFWATKLPKYYVIVVYFSFRLAHFALKTENIVQKITQPKWQKTKNEVTKICDEPGISSKSERTLVRKKILIANLDN